MKIKTYSILALLVPGLALSGCTVAKRPEPMRCAVAGALVGAGGAAAGAAQSSDWDEPEQAAAAGAAGAVLGAAIGYGVCALMKEEAPPPPPPPAPAAAPVEQTDPCKGAVRLKAVNFDLNKATIRPDSEPALRGLADKLKNCPKQKILIEGHTDSSGSDEYNQQLSERRAAAVLKYLVGLGANQAMLESVGYGETRPIATNDTKEGRAENRRVMLRPVD